MTQLNDVYSALKRLRALGRFSALNIEKQPSLMALDGDRNEIEQRILAAARDLPKDEREAVHRAYAIGEYDALQGSLDRRRATAPMSRTKHHQLENRGLGEIARALTGDYQSALADGSPSEDLAVAMRELADEVESVDSDEQASEILGLFGQLVDQINAKAKGDTAAVEGIYDALIRLRNAETRSNFTDLVLSTAVNKLVAVLTGLLDSLGESGALPAVEAAAAIDDLEHVKPRLDSLDHVFWERDHLWDDDRPQKSGDR